MKKKHIALLLLIAGCSSTNSPKPSSSTTVPIPTSKEWMGTWYAKDPYSGITDTLIINDSIAAMFGASIPYDSLVTLNRRNETTLNDFSNTVSGRLYLLGTDIDLIFIWGNPITQDEDDEEFDLAVTSDSLYGTAIFSTRADPEITENPITFTH